MGYQRNRSKLLSGRIYEHKATKAEEGKSFAEIASQKVTEADRQYCLDRASAAFDTIGAHAPDEVRQAWLEASEETGSNGFSITSDGKTFSYPQIAGTTHYQIA